MILWRVAMKFDCDLRGVVDVNGTGRCRQTYCRSVAGMLRCWLVLVAVTVIGSQVGGAVQPNVLMIITDEHNFRTLGCYREVMDREQAEMWGLGAVVSANSSSILLPLRNRLNQWKASTRSGWVSLWGPS